MDNEKEIKVADLIAYNEAKLAMLQEWQEATDENRVGIEEVFEEEYGITL